MLPRASLPKAALAHARLILVNGPAGFGKTTALCQLHGELASQGMAVAWLTLDGDDNDPARFTAYLRALLASVAPAVAEVERRGGAQSDRGAVLGEAFDLIDALASSDRPFALFVDDLEKVTDAEVRAVIARLILTLGAGQRLAVGTRAIPDFGLARLRASGQLLEVGPEQLRFSLEESRRFIGEIHDCAMSPEDVAFVHERTEGWPVALQLAVLAHGGDADGGRRLRAFGGTRAEITDYFATEVVARLPAELRAFLFATSIFETFCAELCDAVTGTGEAAGMIDRVARAHLFLVALDDERRWFRYHALTVEFLRNRLEASNAAALPGMHRRAAGWLAAHGRHAQALEHSRQCGDVDLTAAILDQCATRWLHEGRLTALLRWTETLPVDRLASRPSLHFSAALVSVVSHRFTEAQRLIDALEVPAAEAAGGRARELAMLKFNFAIWSDRLHQLREALDRAVALLTPADGFAYPSMLNCIGYLGILEGNVEMSRSALAAARASPRHRDNEVVRTYSEGEAAMLHLVRGELRDARSVAEAEFERLAEAGNRYGTSSAIVALVLADAHYELNELGAARVLLDEHLGIAEDTCIPDLIISGFIGRSRIARLDGEAKLADELVGRLQRLGERRGLPRLAASATLERSRFALSEGRLETAVAQVAEASAAGFWDHAVFAGTFGNDLHDAAMGRARLELFRGGSAAIAPLETQLRSAEALGRLRRAVKLRGLLAQAHWIAGRRQPALRQLRDALALAAPEGLLRALADEPWVLGDMLANLELRGDSALASFAKRLASACAPSLASPRTSGAAADAAEVLSAREVQILAMLARGLSNKEMARELARSGATVATHLRRIYSKLGAHTRTQAIAIARRGGLID
jgi:LuxR family maltose regulon positive regulatory protein